MGKLVNRARMTVASAPGTGAITLGSAVTGAQTFAAAGVAHGDVVSYVAESGYSNGVATIWEFGQGTYSSSGPTLIRTVVQGGTSGTSPVALTSDAQIFVAALAGDIGISLGAAVNSTTGVAVDFVGIPSTARRLTVMFAGVATNGSSVPLVQLGSGSLQTTGYVGSIAGIANGVPPATASPTAGFGIYSTSSANLLHGQMTLSHMGNNVWTSEHHLSLPSGGVVLTGSGGVALGGVLDRLRVTPTNGVDTFRAGIINLAWE